MRAGAERYMLGLMKRQEEAGHTVAPFSMHYRKNLPSPWSDFFFVSELKTEEGAGRGASALRQFLRAWWSKEAEHKMTAMLDTFQPDIVHVHNIYTHISPSSTISGSDPRSLTITDVLHDIASTTTRPKISYHRDGTTTTLALLSKSDKSSPSTNPRNSTFFSPLASSRNFASYEPVPAIFSFTSGNFLIALIRVCTPLIFSICRSYCS